MRANLSEICRFAQNGKRDREDPLLRQRRKPAFSSLMGVSVGKLLVSSVNSDWRCTNTAEYWLRNG